MTALYRGINTSMAPSPQTTVQLTGHSPLVHSLPTAHVRCSYLPSCSPHQSLCLLSPFLLMAFSFSQSQGQNVRVILEPTCREARAIMSIGWCLTCPSPLPLSPWSGMGAHSQASSPLRGPAESEDLIQTRGLQPKQARLVTAPSAPPPCTTAGEATPMAPEGAVRATGWSRLLNEGKEK